jgi:hypothetical protein
MKGPYPDSAIPREITPMPLSRALKRAARLVDS